MLLEYAMYGLYGYPRVQTPVLSIAWLCVHAINICNTGRWKPLREFRMNGGHAGLIHHAYWTCYRYHSKGSAFIWSSCLSLLLPFFLVFSPLSLNFPRKWIYTGCSKQKETAFDRETQSSAFTSYRSYRYGPLFWLTFIWIVCNNFSRSGAQIWNK